MMQRFIVLLVVVLGTITLTWLGIIDAEVFKSVVVWTFAIFSGAEVSGFGMSKMAEASNTKQENHIKVLELEREIARENNK